VSLNIWYDALDGLLAVSRPVATQGNTETQKLYRDIHVQSSVWERDQSARMVEESTYEYLILFISQFIPQSARLKENFLKGNFEGKMYLGDLSVDGSKISY